VNATVVAKAFVFGVTIAAAIGPIALLIINVSAVDGLARGIRASLGAAVADLVFAITAFAGGYVVTSALASHRAGLSAVASGVLLTLGVWMATQAWRRHGERGSSAKRLLRAPFLQTFALTIVNPLGVIAFLSLAVQLPAVPSLIEMAILSLFVFAGSLLVQVTLAVGGVLLARLAQHTGCLRVLNVASGVGVALFGVAGLLHG
jgi:threonine/homoserine/homoserine lactone efflux protein